MSEEIERKARRHLERCRTLRGRVLVLEHRSREAVGHHIINDPLEASAEGYDGYSPLELIGIKKGFHRVLACEP